MVKKIKNEYFLNRIESIDYLIHAYFLEWCMTRWERGGIRITYEMKNGNRGNAKFEAYKCPRSKVVRLRKLDLDNYFLSMG